MLALGVLGGSLASLGVKAWEKTHKVGRVSKWVICVGVGLSTSIAGGRVYSRYLMSDSDQFLLRLAMHREYSSARTNYLSRHPPKSP